MACSCITHLLPHTIHTFSAHSLSHTLCIQNARNGWNLDGIQADNSLMTYYRFLCDTFSWSRPSSTAHVCCHAAASFAQALDSAGTHIVVGGEGMQPSIWDLSTGSRVWQGKGGKPNRIGLVDKAFTTAVAFLPNSNEDAVDSSSPASAAAGTSGRSEDDGAVSRRFMAGSAAAKLQLYDTAAGRRPQQEVVFGEARVTALSVEPDGTWCLHGGCCVGVGVKWGLVPALLAQSRRIVLCVAAIRFRAQYSNAWDQDL